MPSEAPKVLISYSYDSLEHARRVLGLVERIRNDGVDAQLDSIRFWAGRFMLSDQGGHLMFSGLVHLCLNQSS
jgi:hypothetical protein